jgi:release factor glutamine methyltransferase
VELGLKAIKGITTPHILDLGTGSGAVLLTLLAENENAMGLGVDISEKALDIAMQNADALGLENRAKLAQSDWFDQVEGLFDLIISNPPYITDAAMQTLDNDVKDYDPDLALRGGPDGLAPYHFILAHAPHYLKQGGACWVEIGFDQGPAVEQLFKDHGFKNIQSIQDLSGHDRCVGGVI